ncbi:Uu.00g024800.m01.CDS01 [Anthostomella pinea]|uniref:Uu.00g024800.m01.CDS01 n=1 Tax=Anthostomella pinea TaxID=933095 RepID=A0AAI8V7S0_9PEZI|nr:Uu.00g024800.m01.CDS01 [Anthostomella pinea]
MSAKQDSVDAYGRVQPHPLTRLDGNPDGKLSSQGLSLIFQLLDVLGERAEVCENMIREKKTEISDEQLEVWEDFIEQHRTVAVNATNQLDYAKSYLGKTGLQAGEKDALQWYQSMLDEHRARIRAYESGRTKAKPVKTKPTKGISKPKLTKGTSKPEPSEPNELQPLQRLGPKGWSTEKTKAEELLDAFTAPAPRPWLAPEYELHKLYEKAVEQRKKGIPLAEADRREFERVLLMWAASVQGARFTLNLAKIELGKLNAEEENITKMYEERLVTPEQNLPSFFGIKKDFDTWVAESQAALQAAQEQAAQEQAAREQAAAREEAERKKAAEKEARQREQDRKLKELQEELDRQHAAADKEYADWKKILLAEEKKKAAAVGGGPEFTTLSTRGDGYCGLHAIRLSMEAQHPSISPPTRDELLDVLKDDSERARLIRENLHAAKWINGKPEPDATYDNRSWFLQDHLGAIFSMWADSVGFDAILGIATKGGGRQVHESAISTPQSTIIWIRHNGTDHYEGLRLINQDPPHDDQEFQSASEIDPVGVGPVGGGPNGGGPDNGGPDGGGPNNGGPDGGGPARGGPNNGGPDGGGPNGGGPNNGGPNGGNPPPGGGPDPLPTGAAPGKRPYHEVEDYQLRMGPGWTVNDGTFDHVPENKRRKRDVPYPFFINHAYRAAHGLSTLQLHHDAPVSMCAMDIATDHTWKSLPPELRRCLLIPPPNGPGIWGDDAEARELLYAKMALAPYPDATRTEYKFYRDLKKKPWVIWPIWVEDQWGKDYVLIFWYAETSEDTPEDTPNVYNRLSRFTIIDPRRNPVAGADGKHQPLMARRIRIVNHLRDFLARAGYDRAHTVEHTQILSIPMAQNEASSGERCYAAIKVLNERLVDWLRGEQTQARAWAVFENLPQWVNPYHQRVEMTGINAWMVMASFDFNARIAIENVLPNVQTKLAVNGKHRIIVPFDLAGTFTDTSLPPIDLLSLPTPPPGPQQQPTPPQSPGADGPLSWVAGIAAASGST